MSDIDKKGKKDSKPYSEKDQWEDDLDLPPLEHKKATTKSPILEKAEFDKKRKTPRKFLLLILFIVIAAGSFFILFQPKTENKSALVEEIEAQDSSPKDTIKEELANTVKQIEEESAELWSEDTVFVEEIENIDPIVQYSPEYEELKNFHVIVGSFESEINAKRWLDKVSFEENGVQSIREHLGWHRVIFCSYASVEQAEIEIDSIRNKLNLKAWIAYMK
jgi:hypothetical protein